VAPALGSSCAAPAATVVPVRPHTLSLSPSPSFPLLP
jgi:hypothetical protein